MARLLNNYILTEPVNETSTAIIVNTKPAVRALKVIKLPEGYTEAVDSKYQVFVGETVNVLNRPGVGADVKVDEKNYVAILQGEIILVL